MTFAYVQGANNGGGAGPTQTLAYTSNNTVGNLLVCAVRLSSTGNTITVTDSQGNGGWTQAAAQGQTTDVHTNYLWYCANCKAGANTITVTEAGGATSNIDILIAEYSGVATVTPILDKTASAQTNGSATFSSGNTATTTNPTELLIGSATSSSGNSGLPTANTFGSSVSATGRLGSPGGGVKLFLFDGVTTATGAYAASATWSASGNGTSIIATFLPPGVALTGQAVTSGKGSVSPAATANPTGLTVTSGQGAPVAAISVPLTGLAIVSAQGTLKTNLIIAGLGITSGQGVTIPGSSIPMSGLTIVSAYGTMKGTAQQRTNLPSAPPTVRSVNMQALCYEVDGPVRAYPIYQFSRGRVFIKRPYENPAAGEVPGSSSSGGGPGL